MIATADAPNVAADEVELVVLSTGEILAEVGEDLSALAASVTLEPPFRAHGVRREGGIWVVAASRIRTVALADDPGGDSVEVAWDGMERTVRIDGAPTLAGIPALERLGALRSATYVVTASRLAGRVWEVSVAPL